MRVKKHKSTTRTSHKAEPSDSVAFLERLKYTLFLSGFPIPKAFREGPYYSMIVLEVNIHLTHNTRDMLYIITVPKFSKGYQRAEGDIATM